MIFKVRLFMLMLIPILLISCSSKTQEILILKDGNLIDVNTGKAKLASLYIENGKIKEIGRFNNFPKSIRENGEIIDCHSKYILPGLIDMHIHIYEEQNSYQYLDELLYRGITTIRDMGGKADSIANWISNQNKTFQLVPNIYFVGYTLDGKGSSDPNHILIKNRNDIDSVILKLDKLQVDFIKVHNFFPDSLINSLVYEGKAKNLEVVGHIPRGVELEYAIKNFETVEHVSSFVSALVFDKSNEIKNIPQAFAKLDTNYLNKISQLFVESETAFTPTLFTHYLGYEETQDSLQLAMGRRMYKRFEIITKQLAENNVRILAGSDVVPLNSNNANSLYMELKALSNAGLNSLKVIQSATINPAKSLKIDDKYGTIEQGKFADLIILEENPMDNVSNLQKIQFVVKNGQIINIKTAANNGYK